MTSQNKNVLSCCLSIALISLIVMGSAACTASSSQTSTSTTALRTAEKQDVRPFTTYFLDSDEGECVLIDMGDKEIIINAGGTRNQLREYVTKTGLIQDPIELIVVTNSDFRSWQGLSSLLELDKDEDSRKYHAMELWEPGYNRNAGDTPNPNSAYGKFVEKIQSLPDTKVKRPLETFHAPSNKTQKIDPFTLPSLPGVNFTLLHSDKNPGMDETVSPKNSSIVLLVEISGIRMLFTSNAPGKDSSDPETVEPKYVEGKLLALNGRYPGLLRADLMTMPRHGGADASTRAFIDAVDPKIVISSSLARFNFPLRAVVDRYQKLGRRVFVTSLHREPGLDDIVCTNQVTEVNEEGDSDTKPTTNLNCLYSSLDAKGQSKWTGFLKDQTPYDQEKLSSYLSENVKRLAGRERGSSNRDDKAEEMRLDTLRGADLRGADLSGRNLSGLDLSGADLEFSNLSGTILSYCNLSGANLSYAFSPQSEVNPDVGPEKNTKFIRANLSGANLNYAQLPNGELREALLENASLKASYLPAATLNGTRLSNSNLDYANLREARIIGGRLDRVTLTGADLSHVIFEPDPGFLPSFNEFIRAPYLESLSFERSPHALVELREAFKKAGLRQQERILTFDIEHQKRLREGFIARTFGYVMFEGTARYGLSPMRPLGIVLLIWFIFSLLYYILLRSTRSGLILVVARRRTDDPGRYRTKTHRLGSHSLQGLNGLKRWKLFLVSEFRLLMASINFGLRSMFNLKFQWLEAGTWLRMVQRRQYDLEAIGWVRTLSGLQSLISMYLLALCILTYFGRPFD